MKYLIAAHDGQYYNVRPFLGFGAIIVVESRPHNLAIIAAPDEHALWMAHRLKSGLLLRGLPGQGTDPFETLDAAHEALRAYGAEWDPRKWERV
jgi:hypothetical protein